MIVGTLELILTVPGSQSLKDKRHVVRSLLDTVRNRFNASAAEIGALDSLRRAELGFACVSNDKDVVHRLLSKIIDLAESNPLCEVVDTNIEIS
jgi:uncharacterized protein YlxP (DUF503 family)